MICSTTQTPRVFVRDVEGDDASIPMGSQHSPLPDVQMSTRNQFQFAPTLQQVEFCMREHDKATSMFYQLVRDTPRPNCRRSHEILSSEFRKSVQREEKRLAKEEKHMLTVRQNYLIMNQQFLAKLKRSCSTTTIS